MLLYRSYVELHRSTDNIYGLLIQIHRILVFVLYYIFFSATAFATTCKTEGGGGGSKRIRGNKNAASICVVYINGAANWLTGGEWKMLCGCFNFNKSIKHERHQHPRAWVWNQENYVPISMAIKIPRVITLNQRRRHTSRRINHAQVIRYRLLVHRNDEWTQITNK